MAKTITELSKLEHTLADGTRLTSFDLILIELLRQRKSDAYIRGCLDLYGEKLTDAARRVRSKLQAETWESIGIAAERHGLPRVEL